MLAQPIRKENNKIFNRKHRYQLLTFSVAQIFEFGAIGFNVKKGAN